MRFAVIYRPKHPVPPQQLPELLRGMGEWMENYADRIDVQFFVGGGGIGTIETEDSADVSRILATHPFTQYSDVEIKPLIDPATAMSILMEACS